MEYRNTIRKTLLVCVVFILTIYSMNGLIIEKLYAWEKKMVHNKIFSSTSDYLHSESLYSNIYYTEADENLVALIQRNVDFYLPLLLADFSIDYDDYNKLDFIVFPDAESLCRALDIPYESPPMGVYYGGVINILSPYRWLADSSEADVKDRFMQEGPLVHEITHYMTDLKTGGNYKVWFTEGISLYYEKKYMGFEWRPDLKESSALISYDDLNANFKSLDESLAYRKSFDLVSNMLDKYGEEGLQRTLRLLGEGREFDKLITYTK